MENNMKQSLADSILYFPEKVFSACGSKVYFHVDGPDVVGLVEVILPDKTPFHLNMVWDRYSGLPRNLTKYPTYYYYRLVVKD
jgi:hypothetical protein